jgi:hypothetical protein
VPGDDDDEPIEVRPSRPETVDKVYNEPKPTHERAWEDEPQPEPSEPHRDRADRDDE